MKQSLRITAAAAAMALLFAAAPITALAEETGLSIGASYGETYNVAGGPQPSVSPSAAPTAAPTAEPTTEPTAPPTDPTPTPQSNADVYVSAVTLTDKAGGEIPEVKWGDVFNVVLRVVDHSSARNNVTAEEISARVNSSVFTYTGNGEIGQLVEGEDTEGRYYSYVLLFRDVIYNGGGNTFPINLSYLDTSMAMQQFSVTLGQCIDKDPDDPSKLRSPNLVVRQSSYGNAAVVAGQPFTLSLTVYATTGTENLNDVITSLTLPDGVSLTGGSLSSYVGSMNAQSTRDVSYSILPSASYATNVANITVNMTGTGAKTGTAVTGSTTISVPISQPDRFELGTLECNDTVNLGETTSITLNFVNKGKNPVGNVEGTVTGTNIGAELSNQYVGNVNAGTENSVDFDLTPEAAGPASGTITLTYEDPNGGVKTVTKDFSFTVAEAMAMDPGMEMPTEEPTQKPGLPIWGYVLIALAVIVVVVIIVVAVRKRKKAADLAKLEEGDDETI